MTDPVLDQIYEYCRYNAPVVGEDRELSFDGVLCILLYRGLLKVLPVLQTLTDSDPQMIKLRRVDIVNQLVDYAINKDLNENDAFNCAGLIARCITSDNIESLVSELQDIEEKRKLKTEPLHDLEASLS